MNLINNGHLELILTVLIGSVVSFSWYLIDKKLVCKNNTTAFHSIRPRRNDFFVLSVFYLWTAIGPDIFRSLHLGPNFHNIEFFALLSVIYFLALAHLAIYSCWRSFWFILWTYFGLGAHIVVDRIFY